MKSPSPRCLVLEQIFVNAPAGVRAIWSVVCLSLVAVLKNACKKIKSSTFVASRTSVNIYKGLCMPADLPRFYLGLADLRLESAICLFHQRFSTNTVPRWPLAQPFRYPGAQR